MIDLIKVDDYVYRFMSKVKFFDKDKCWEWSGHKVRSGYGHFGLNGKIIRAHRFSYMISKGTIPKGKYVCHTCDFPACINPDHLWLGTAKENTADCIKKGRMSNGNDRKTHCNRGHALSGVNLEVDKNEKRRCVICKKKYMKKYYIKNKDKINARSLARYYKNAD